MLSFIAVLALSAQMLSPYIAWPSRWNVPMHITVGVCLTSYIVPGLLTDVWSDYTSAMTMTFIQLNVVGAVAICLGTALGSFYGRNWYARGFQRPSQHDPLASGVVTRVSLVVAICIAGMVIAYGIMGFVPMFAEDPYAARQFKGVYQDMYYRAAYLYRFSFSVLQTSIALALALALVRRSVSLFALAFVGFLVLFVSLSRGPAAAGVLLFLGIYAARKKGMLKWYFVLVAAVIPLGSMLFYFLGQVLDVQALQDGVNSSSLSDYISNGSPDISDQITWLQGFMKGEYFSYGRTMFGGLIPFSYPWNPGVWTLTYDDVGADVSEIASGGLRLTPAEWGYANFGWPGVVLLPLVSGIISGLILSQIRRIVPHLNIWRYTAVILLYMTLGQQLIQFYLLSIHNIPAIIVCVLFWRWSQEGTASDGGARPFQAAGGAFPLGRVPAVPVGQAVRNAASPSLLSPASASGRPGGAGGSDVVA